MPKMYKECDMCGGKVFTNCPEAHIEGAVICYECWDAMPDIYSKKRNVIR